MTAMFPDSGVIWTDARNSLADPNTQNCSELWYSTSRCQPRFDPAAANAMLAELVNLINKGEVSYNCNVLTQVELATRYLIQRGLPRGTALFGGGNTYAGALDPTLTRYNDFLTLSLLSPENNTGPVTVQLNGLTPVPLRRNDGKELEGGDLYAGKPFQAIVYQGVLYMSGMVKSQTQNTFDLDIAIFDVDAIWTVPPGVTGLQIEAWGAGGGGGAGDGITGGGGGGGGGEYGLAYYKVVPNSAVTIAVGQGGVGGNTVGQRGAAGGATTVTIQGIGQVMQIMGGGGGNLYGEQGSGPGQGGTIVGSGELVSGSGGFIPNTTWGGGGSPGGGTTRGRLYAMQGNFGLPPGGGGCGNQVNNALAYNPGADGRVKITYPRVS